MEIQLIGLDDSNSLISKFYGNQFNQVYEKLEDTKEDIRNRNR